MSLPRFLLVAALVGLGGYVLGLYLAVHYGMIWTWNP